MRVAARCLTAEERRRGFLKFDSCWVIGWRNPRSTWLDDRSAHDPLQHIRWEWQRIPGALTWSGGRGQEVAAVELREQHSPKLNRSSGVQVQFPQQASLSHSPLMSVKGTETQRQWSGSSTRDQTILCVRLCVCLQGNVVSVTGQNPLKTLSHELCRQIGTQMTESTGLHQMNSSSSLRLCDVWLSPCGTRVRNSLRNSACWWCHTTGAKLGETSETEGEEPSLRGGSVWISLLTWLQTFVSQTDLSY